MNVAVFIGFECFAIFINLCFITDVWFRSRVNQFLKWTQLGLVIVNILNSTVSLAVDITITRQDNLNWPLCFVIFLNSPFCTHATLMLIIAINIERILAIKWPQLHRVHTKQGMWRLVIACTLLLAVLLSSTGIPDLVTSYRRSNSSHCLVSDYFKLGYLPILSTVTDGVLVVVLMVCVTLFIATLVSFSKQRHSLAGNSALLMAQKHKALVMSRITLASSILYTVSVGYRVFFILWVKVVGCDDNCHNLETFAVLCEIAFLTIPIQDPLVYFFSVIKWSSLSKPFSKLCQAKPRRNQVMPAHIEVQ